MLSSISLLKMVSINIKKRHLKFLFLVLVVFGISFAFSALQAEVPDPGHPVSEIQKCGEGEVLEIVNGAWDCVSGRITCADLPGGSCAVDSRIGAVTSANPSDGNWCKRDANGKINCLNVAPVGTGGGSGCSIVDNGDFVTITCGSNSANVYDGQDGVDGTCSAGQCAGTGIETDPTVPANLKDGVSWGEISSRPAGLDNGDDVGVLSCSIRQSSFSGVSGTVNCLSGEKATGGGARCTIGNEYPESYPSSETQWLGGCFKTNTGGVGSGGTVYAMCCKVV
jgi:hypothetical protein